MPDGPDLVILAFVLFLAALVLHGLHRRLPLS
jgi:hypothetical protein